MSQAIASKLAHIKEFSSQQPNNTGIFTPPIIANTDIDKSPNQGIIRGKENTLEMKGNGNYQGLYKEREFTKPENHVFNQQEQNATPKTGGTFGMNYDDLREAFELDKPEPWEAEPF